MKAEPAEVKGQRFILLLFVFFGMLVFAGSIWFLFVEKSPIMNKISRREYDIEGTANQEVVEDVRSGKSFEEVKRKNPGIVSNPNISSRDIKEAIIKDTNLDPQKYDVAFDGVGFSPVTVTIRQGDVVTWRNESGSPFVLEGESWGSVVPIQPSKAFSQGFDFVGTYKYHVQGKKDITGEIVVSPTP